MPIWTVIHSSGPIEADTADEAISEFTVNDKGGGHWEAFPSSDGAFGLSSAAARNTAGARRGGTFVGNPDESLEEEAERRFPGDSVAQLVWTTLVDRDNDREGAAQAVDAAYDYEPFGRLIDEIEDAIPAALRWDAEVSS